MENQISATDQRRRKFLMVMPLIVLPFLTLMFWALGGGKMEAAEGKGEQKTGLNNKLPDANLRDEKGLDKMSYYDQALKDSAKLKESLLTDPYNQQLLAQSQAGGILQAPITTNGYGMANSPYRGPGYQTSADARIYQKLDQLNQTLNQPSGMPSSGNAGYQQGATFDDASVQRLEKMMQQMQSGTNVSDPETEQLDGMLEKVLDIQYPERAMEKIRKSSQQHKGQVFAVAAAGKRDYISILEGAANTSQASTGNGFYSLEEPLLTDTAQNAIDAVVHETQTIVNGSTVKLRLLDDVYINGKLIPRDNFIYGRAALNGERLSIKITGVRFNKNLFPVELSVFDIDGMDGIYIPGAIAREVAKESADRAIQDVSFGSMSPSIGVQAASAGVEAAKSLFSKKIKLIKVTVKAGYKVLLRDEKQKQDNQ